MKTALISGSGLGDCLGRIHAAWARGAENVLELAALMRQVRVSLRRGWSVFWRTKKLPFAKRTGDKLVAVAKGFDGVSEHGRAQLPAALNTLHCLSKLGCTKIEDLIEDGRIHPGLTLDEAKALLTRLRPGTRRAIPRSKLQRRLANFAEFVGANMEGWSEQERRMVTEELAALAAEIRKASDRMAAAQKTTEARDADANQTHSVRQTL